MQHWSLNYLANLHWRDFGDEWVVFDVASGQTHCLDGVSAVVLMRLQDGPTNVDGLAEFVCSLGPERSEALNLQITDIVLQLQSIGLIAPTDS